MSDGKVIAFEGPDGVGKSSLCRRAAEFLLKSGIESVSVSLPGKQQGTIGRFIYNLTHDRGEMGIRQCSPLTLQTLHVAAQIEMLETDILPALRRGKWVLLDRFWWSTAVYGRAAGIGKIELDELLDFARKRWSSAVPAIIFLIERGPAFRSERDETAFAALTALYRELAEAKQSASRVHVVRQRSFKNACQEIEAAISTHLMASSAV